MAKISFTTSSGERVSFHTTGRKSRKAKRKPNAFAKFVQKNIHAFLDDGIAAPQAMKRVAKKYHAEKRSSKKRRSRT